VDLPPEEEHEITPALAATGLKLIRLVAPTSGEKRLKMLSASASGFIYYISVTGITGAKSADVGALKSQIDHLKTITSLPVAVGFGIKTSAQVKQFAAFSDAVVVGSALVEAMSRAQGVEDKVQSVRQFIAGLTEGLKH
jgi:tryptophan synthase alpha chain